MSEKRRNDKRRGVQSIMEGTEAYFRRCEEKGTYPSITGLALALGFDSRQELQDRAGANGKAAAALRRAASQVEEANVQAAYRRESSMGARFFLQNGFGYSDKKQPELIDDTITVTLTGEDEE